MVPNWRSLTQMTAWQTESSRQMTKNWANSTSVISQKIQQFLLKMRLNSKEEHHPHQPLLLIRFTVEVRIKTITTKRMKTLKTWNLYQAFWRVTLISINVIHSHFLIWRVTTNVSLLMSDILLQMFQSWQKMFGRQVDYHNKISTRCLVLVPYRLPEKENI